MKQQVTWHVHSNGRSHAFTKGTKLSVCGSVRLTKAPQAAPLIYPCCNCLRLAGDPRKGNP